MASSWSPGGTKKEGNRGPAPCRAGSRALVGLGLLPRLGLGSPRALGCPSAVTVGKVHPSWVGAPEISLPEGGNLLPYCKCPEQSAGSHMERPHPSMVPQGAAVTPTPEPWPGRAGICFPGKHTGAGRLGLRFLPACLVGRCWANRKQEQGRWSRVSPQQESLLCPVDHDVFFLLCRSSSAAGRALGASSASRVQAAGLGSATQQQQPQVAQTKAE